MSDLFAGLPESQQPFAGQPEEIPWTLDRAIDVFLHRWAFNWRAERGVIESELRALITEAKAHR
jgi:hypothetical protein